MAIPQQYRAWSVLGTALVFQASTFGIGFFAFTLWVETWAAEFDTTRSTIMLIFLVAQCMMGAVAPFAGKAMDRLSIRVLVICGTCSFSLALLLISFATSWWHIAVVYGTLFVAGPMLAGPLAAQTLAARWFPRHRGTAIGISSIGTSIGGALFPLLIAWLMVNYDWRTAHQVLAVFVLILIVPLTWVVVRNSPAELSPSANAGQPESGGQWTTKGVLRERRFWVIVLAFIPMMIATGGVQQNIGPFSHDQGLTPAQTATLVSLMAVVMIGGKLFFGALADYIQHRYLFWISLVLIGATLILLYLAPGYVGLMIAISLLGFGMGGFLPLLGAMVAGCFGSASFGLVMGLVGPFATLAAVGPLIAGAIRDYTGSYQFAWMFFLGVAVISALIMAAMPGDRTDEAQGMIGGNLEASRSPS